MSQCSDANVDARMWSILINWLQNGCLSHALRYLNHKEDIDGDNMWEIKEFFKLPRGMYVDFDSFV